MVAHNVEEFDDGNLEFEVTDAQQPVLVEFADAHRRMDDDLLNEIANKYEGRARIAFVDATGNYDAACRFGVQHFPSVLLFQNGHVVDRLIGREAREVYCRCIDEALCPSYVI